jgi:hypothetical protein
MKIQDGHHHMTKFNVESYAIWKKLSHAKLQIQL